MIPLAETRQLTLHFCPTGRGIRTNRGLRTIASGFHEGAIHLTRTHFLMRFISVIFGIVIATTLAGCAVFPPLPTIVTARGDRIGVFVESGDTPLHTHIGTTVFNNFEKKYDYNWNLKTEITNIVQRSITSAGFIPIDLQAQGIRYSDVQGLIRPAGGKWEVPKDKDEALRRLRSDLRLKALVVLKEARVMTARECTGGPCSERYADGSGLYTRSFLNMTSYSAVAAYQWNVFVLDSPADTVLAEPLWSIVKMPSARILEFKSPANFDNLTEAEFAPVREAVLSFVEGASAAAVKSLNPK